MYTSEALLQLLLRRHSKFNLKDYIYQKFFQLRNRNDSDITSPKTLCFENVDLTALSRVWSQLNGLEVK